MKQYTNVLLWILAGFILGSILYVLINPAPSSYAPQTNNSLSANQTILNHTTTGNSNQTNESTGQLSDNKAAVSITVIEAPDCPDCNGNGIYLLQSELTINDSSKLKVGSARSISLSSAEAAALISKYNITELPAVIIEGPVQMDADLVSGWIGGVGTYTSGALVTKFRYPPYYDVANHTIIGLIRGYGIRAHDCLECEAPELLLTSLESYQIGMVFSNKTVYEENSTEAQALIAKYNITRLPVIILSTPEASAYSAFEQIKKFGTIEDGWFILRDVMPPFIDLSANRTLRGVIQARLIGNASCTDCFNITEFSNYLSDASGLAIANKTYYDVSSAEGKALIAKYNITSIPTLLYSPDTKYYVAFTNIWKEQNNTVESDGWFVFRAHNLLSSGVVYQNISS